MLVYGFVGDRSGFMAIKDTLKAKQDFVNGLIEVISLTDEIDLIVNEEYLLNGSELRLLLVDDDREIWNIVKGDCFICRNDGEGNFVSIKREDISIIEKYLIHVNCDELRVLSAIILGKIANGK